MTIKRVLRIGLLGLLLSRGSALAEVQQNISYGPDPEQKLDVCTPEPPGKTAPAVLMIHGGAWHAGSRLGYFRQQCRNFARAGVVAIPMDYRLAPPAPGGPIWPAQLDDVQLAMRWVRAHAATYGIDPHHLCAEGDSAGGHLALLLDVMDGIAPGDMQNILPGISPRADCVISVSGPSDMVGMASVLRNAVSQLFGPGDPAHIHAEQLAASPALQVHPGAAPALLIHGLSDPAVPFGQALEMQAAFAHARTPVWLITHQGGHEMNGLTPAQVQALWPLIADFVKNRRLAVPPGQLPIEQILQ